MKNKKGFTLIELLAVIVILAIIMVIATMQVNKTIKKARQDSFALSFKSLKKQIQQRIVTGEEYLCYDSVRGNGKISNMHDFFGNNFPSICGTGTKDQIRSKKEIINGEEKEFYVTGTISDYGVRACQDIYDISDDYRMWVSYQAANGDVSLLLNTTDGKFKGTPYIQGVVENIGGTEMVESSTLLKKDLEIKYKNGKLAGSSISMIDSNDCVYDAKWNHFNNTNWRTSSYECYYRWNKSKIDNIKDKLQKAADKNKNKGNVTIGEACKILTNPDNWN